MAISVSAEWKTATEAQFRYPAYLKCRLRVVPPGLHEAEIVTSNDTDIYSAPQKLSESAAGFVVPYASLESDRWKLNGTFKILAPNGVTSDWWSTLSGNTKTLHFTFDQPYLIPGVFFTWDEVSKTYPTDFHVIGYNVAHTQTYDYRITDTNSFQGLSRTPMDNVKYVDIVINKWSKPNWRVRVAEITFGIALSYDSSFEGRIRSAKMSSSSSPILDELPAYSFSVTLDNTDTEFDPELQKGLSRYIVQRQRIYFRWGFEVSPGFVEWTNDLPYYLDSFTIPPKSKEVVFEASSRLKFLSGEFQYGNYTGSERTVYDILQYILTKSSVFKETKETTPWVLEETLKSFTTSAPISIGATNSLLQLVAGSAGHFIRIDPETGYLRFTQSLVRSGQQITEMQELGDPETSVPIDIKTISVGVHSYSVKTTVAQIGAAKLLLKGATVTKINYEKPSIEVTAAISNGVINKVDYYVSCAVLTVTPTNPSVEVDIVFNGKEILDTVSYLDVYSNSLITNGKEYTVNNPYVTNLASAQHIGNLILATYSKKQQYKAAYLGYPELLPGDTIQFKTPYQDFPKEVTVTSNTIDFNGAWTGNIEVV